MNFLDDFSEFLQSLGFIVNNMNIKADGKFHRIGHADDKVGKKSGSYILFNDRHPAGYVQNFKAGQSFNWKYKGNKLCNFINPEKYAQIKAQREAEQTAIYNKNAWAAFKKFQTLSFNYNGESYLTRKHVKAYGIKFDNSGNLYIPYRNNNGHIQTLQIITPTGEKKFAHGCKKMGGYHKAGFYNIDTKPLKKYKGYILVGEGYATMASIYMATKIPVVIAGDVGNLAPVIANLGIKYPQAQIVICADNDVVGIAKANECKSKYLCKVIIPNLPHNSGLTDFNDLLVVAGIKELETQIISGLNA